MSPQKKKCPSFWTGESSFFQSSSLLFWRFGISASILFAGTPSARCPQQWGWVLCCVIVHFSCAFSWRAKYWWSTGAFLHSWSHWFRSASLWQPWCSWSWQCGCPRRLEADCFGRFFWCSRHSSSGCSSSTWWWTIQSFNRGCSRAGRADEGPDRAVFFLRVEAPQIQFINRDVSTMSWAILRIINRVVELQGPGWAFCHQLCWRLAPFAWEQSDALGADRLECIELHRHRMHVSLSGLARGLLLRPHLSLFHVLHSRLRSLDATPVHVEGCAQQLCRHGVRCSEGTKGVVSSPSEDFPSDLKETEAHLRTAGEVLGQVVGLQSRAAFQVPGDGRNGERRHLLSTWVLRTLYPWYLVTEESGNNLFGARCV